MSDPELLSIIVPVYNEVRTSRAVIDRLAIDLPLPREVLVVDDGSTDGTGEVLATALRERLPITVPHAERNSGKGRAIRHGLRHARGSIVVGAQVRIYRPDDRERYRRGVQPPTEYAR